MIAIIMISMDTGFVILYLTLLWFAQMQFRMHLVSVTSEDDVVIHNTPPKAIGARGLQGIIVALRIEA